MDDKVTLRTKAKNIRKKLDTDKISSELCDLIRQNSFYKNAKNIMIYYPKQYEIDLRELLNDNKNFYLPRVNGKNLEVCPYVKGDLLIISEFNILEPCSNSCSINDLDLIILPALMADKNGYRLGYGKGYYDKFLEKKPQKLKTLLPVPKDLLTDELPHYQHDIKCDCVITCK